MKLNLRRVLDVGFVLALAVLTVGFVRQNAQINRLEKRSDLHHSVLTYLMESDQETKQFMEAVKGFFEALMNSIPDQKDI